MHVWVWRLRAQSVCARMAASPTRCYVGDRRSASARTFVVCRSALGVRPRSFVAHAEGHRAADSAHCFVLIVCVVQRAMVSLSWLVRASPLLREASLPCWQDLNASAWSSRSWVGVGFSCV